MAEKSKILIIGGTGYIGKFIVKASAKAGHPTFALVRETTVSDPVKGKLIDSFKNSGVTLLYGDIYDNESLVKAIKQVDVVISTVGHMQLADQVKIIAAIKEVGNVKRFFPSEFGNDVDRSHAVEPAKSAFAIKAQIRRVVEAEGIPYTYVSANCFAGYFLPTLMQPGATAPPRDKVIILGDGNPKAVFNKEDDIGTYTIKAVDDPRTLNKVVYLKPPKNIYSFNELVALWEKKIGKTLEKIYVPEEQLLKDIQDKRINKYKPVLTNSQKREIWRVWALADSTAPTLLKYTPHFNAKTCKKRTNVVLSELEDEEGEVPVGAEVSEEAGPEAEVGESSRSQAKTKAKGAKKGRLVKKAQAVAEGSVEVLVVTDSSSSTPDFPPEFEEILARGASTSGRSFSTEADPDLSPDDMPRLPIPPLGGSSSSTPPSGPANLPSAQARGAGSSGSKGSRAEPPTLLKATGPVLQALPPPPPPLTMGRKRSQEGRGDRDGAKLRKLLAPTVTEPPPGPPELWAPAFMVGDRPVSVADSAKDTKVGAALCSAFYLPRDMASIGRMGSSVMLDRLSHHAAQVGQLSQGLREYCQQLKEDARAAELDKEDAQKRESAVVARLALLEAEKAKWDEELKARLEERKKVDEDLVAALDRTQRLQARADKEKKELEAEVARLTDWGGNEFNVGVEEARVAYEAQLETLRGESWNAGYAEGLSWALGAAGVPRDSLLWNGPLGEIPSTPEVPATGEVIPGVSGSLADVLPEGPDPNAPPKDAAAAASEDVVPA